MHLSICPLFKLQKKCFPSYWYALYCVLIIYCLAWNQYYLKSLIIVCILSANISYDESLNSFKRNLGPSILMPKNISCWAIPVIYLVNWLKIKIGEHPTGNSGNKLVLSSSYITTSTRDSSWICRNSQPLLSRANNITRSHNI